jgi:hypothetical protein
MSRRGEKRAAPGRPFLLAGLLLIGGAGTGCRTYRDQSAPMREAWLRGDYVLAAEQYGRQADKKKDGGQGIIWQLEAGTAYRVITNYPTSNRYFDAAAAHIAEYEKKARVRLSNELGATMSNQQNRPYEGRSYDKIMLHTYKALNYLALGEIERARPELIRAYQRQQDAVRENARRIARAREAERQSEHRQQIEAARKDPTFSAALKNIESATEGFRFYADYVNPFTVYLDGIYFRHASTGPSDWERARKSLRRVLEVAGDNPFVRAELKDFARPPFAHAPITYVILETGQAASREEERIDVPIIVSTVSYVGAAFPKLVFHDDYLRSLSVQAGDTEAQTALIADMDAIIALDFKNEWPAIVTRTIISAVAKGAAAYAANESARQADESFGLFVQLMTALTQMALNIADTRSWTTLPKQFQVARVPTPENRTLTLRTPDGREQAVKLVEGVVNVVYVRAVTSSSPLVISQFKLK